MNIASSVHRHDSNTHNGYSTGSPIRRLFRMIPKSKQYSDGEVISAHRQFARKLRLSRWKPVREVKFLGFDGWKGTVAYDLDWGEGWIRESILKALFYKVVLRKPLTELRYYVLDGQHPQMSPQDRKV